MALIKNSVVVSSCIDGADVANFFDKVSNWIALGGIVDETCSFVDSHTFEIIGDNSSPDVVSGLNDNVFNFLIIKHL